ncbi:4a-hydroxytetrahydrobiopterin dehydratase domain protein [Ancylostoma duodenale]|uniref:4a-hydroxytetrahydrobiopterin dehydratase domain protein n=1 Tax=Ancylostoma duodenale TaxID=51022 RepID=A0A0C2DZ21_9BILA|nr:4a-hydroxytetrahydrobiopterin dehydratase domain protein [Ancylostoma duodenale]
MVVSTHLLLIALSLIDFCTCAAPDCLKKLNEEQRKEVVSPLLSQGWQMVEGRDALRKVFQFKDFNEVNVHSNNKTPKVVKTADSAM